MAQRNLSKIVDDNGNEYLIKAKGLEDQVQVSLTGDVSGSVTSDFTSDPSISTTIGTGKVSTTKLADSAVTTVKINDKAVTLDKIADSARGGAVQDNDGVLATHAQVKDYVDAVASGEGKYRGTQTVATINGWTVANLNNGDRVITADAGTITFNGQSLAVDASQELVLWKDTGTSPVTAVWQTSEGNYKLKQTAKTDPTASGTTITAIDTISQNSNGEITATKKTIRSASTSQTGVVQLSNSTSSTSTTQAATANAVKTAYDLANGKYTKPSTGIPKTDLATAVQTSLDKADTAIQGVKLEGASAALTPDANNVVTVPNAVATGTTGATNGLMTAADKAKLDNVGVQGGADTGSILQFVNTADAGYGRKDGYVGLGGYTNEGRLFIGTNTSGELVFASSDDLETFVEKGKVALGSDLDDKADKVSGATSGNFAGLDANGNLTDSGKKAADFATAGHAHGNITNDGAITATGVAIASGDALVITDASDSSKVKKTSIAFDGSTDTKALTQKGTWETFNNYTHPSYTAATAAAVKVGRDATGHVVLGSALAKGDVGLGNVDNTSDATKKTNFTGSIASGGSGFVTGGAVYTALAGKEDGFSINYRASDNALVFTKKFGTAS